MRQSPVATPTFFVIVKGSADVRMTTPFDLDRFDLDTQKGQISRVKHFYTTTQYGESVLASLADNTVVLRLFGEDELDELEEWSKTEHRYDQLHPSIEAEFSDASFEAVHLSDLEWEHEGYKAVQVILTNPAGEQVVWQTSYFSYDGWGRVLGPWYRTATLTSEMP